jgi:glycosidase
VCWARDAFFYHIYPLGLCGAPARNDPGAQAVERPETLHEWVEHMAWLGADALYLGPVFESRSHGYDTTDYTRVDRRLGTNDSLVRVIDHLHAKGMRIVPDTVFNHVGRDFFAFRDLLVHGEGSRYRTWFSGLDFDKPSPLGDPFMYDTWGGHYELAKLNLREPEVADYLKGVAAGWIDTFGVDGLRPDAANEMDVALLQALAAHCRALRGDFFLLGEAVHGDYRRWANPQTLDSATNYEAYKGLYSSHNDRNYFEIAYPLKREFGEEGLYTGLPLHNFADNHDVNRVASTLAKPAHLYPLLVRHEQLAFLRVAHGQRCIVAVNAEEREVALELPVSGDGVWQDVLGGGEVAAGGGRLEVTLNPCWGAVLVPA